MRVGVDPPPATPLTYETWPGIRGRRHGEVNETIPAKNARAKRRQDRSWFSRKQIVERGLQDLSIQGSQEPIPDHPPGSRELEFLNPSGYDFSVLVGRMTDS